MKRAFASRRLRRLAHAGLAASAQTRQRRPTGRNPVLERAVIFPVLLCLHKWSFANLAAARQALDETANAEADRDNCRAFRRPSCGRPRCPPGRRDTSASRDRRIGLAESINLSFTIRSDNRAWVRWNGLQRAEGLPGGTNASATTDVRPAVIPPGTTAAWWSRAHRKRDASCPCERPCWCGVALSIADGCYRLWDSDVSRPHG